MADRAKLYDHPRSSRSEVDEDDDSINERRAKGNKATDADHKRYSGGKKWGERLLTDEERKAPFKKRPDKEVDGHKFENVDPRKEWAIVPDDALPKYRKEHYDRGGDYDHWDEDSETKEKTYWRPKQAEKPTS